MSFFPNNLTSFEDSAFKESVVVATTTDLAASLGTATTLTGYDDNPAALALTTTAASTTVTTTSTASIKPGATVSVATVKIAAGTTVASITNATTFVVNNRANITTTAITGSGTTATATFATQTYAPYAVGSVITIAGAVPTTYNGNFTVTACTTTSVSWASTETVTATTQGTISFVIAAGSAISTTFIQTIAVLQIDGVNFDGTNIKVGDRILVKDQSTLGGVTSDTRYNGIYSVTTLGSTTVPWVLTRTQDANTTAEMASAVIAVDKGTSNGGKLFTNVLKSSDTLGTTLMPIYEVMTSSGGTISGATTFSSNLTLSGDIAVNGGDITTTATTFGLVDTTATTVNFAGAATTCNFGYDGTAANTINLGIGATAASTTKTLNIGTGGAASSTTNINLGSSNGGTLTVSSPNTTFNQTASGLFKVAATAAPTSDMVQITNAGFGIATAGVNCLNVTYVAGDAAVEASAMRIDMTPSTTASNISSGLRIVCGNTTASTTNNGVKFDNITTSSGTDSMLYAGTGWDNILSYNGTSIIDGTGLVNATKLTGTVPVANGGTGVTTSTGTGSVVLSASPTLTGTPLAPTATAGTNTTQIATTEFVERDFVKPTDYASSDGTIGGTVKARISGNTLYIRTDGTNA